MWLWIAGGAGVVWVIFRCWVPACRQCRPRTRFQPSYTAPVITPYQAPPTTTTTATATTTDVLPSDSEGTSPGGGVDMPNVNIPHPHVHHCVGHIVKVCT